jgi:hypothetical protein
MYEGAVEGTARRWVHRKVVQPQEAGAAAGTFTTSQQFASSAGVAVIGAVFFAVAGPHPATGGYAHAGAPLTFPTLPPLSARIQG